VIRSWWRAHREDGWFWLLAGPTLLGFVLLTLGPMVVSLYLSLTSYDIVGSPEFIGFENYMYLIQQDPAFWTSVWVTVIYALVHVPLSLFSALAVAMLLNVERPFIGVFRTIYFLPSILPPTASAVLFVFIFNPESGLLNGLLGWMGIEGPAWLSSTTWALPSLILISLWGFGNAMLIFLGGLQGVSTTLYEAASIDGAGAIGKFWHVTLPQISPIFFFNLIMGVIAAMKVFDLAYAFGAAQGMVPGGPARSTLFFVLYLYQKAFTYFHFGVASAMAWMMFAVIIVITALNFLLARYWVHYEN
jgi:multiple sugar transport system permease protein